MSIGPALSGAVHNILTCSDGSHVASCGSRPSLIYLEHNAYAHAQVLRSWEAGGSKELLFLSCIHSRAIMNEIKKLGKKKKKKKKERREKKNKHFEI